METSFDQGVKGDDVEMEEDEDIEGSKELEDPGKLTHRAKQVRDVTSRNVTLNTLMDDGIIQPGKGVLSIDYLGQRFEADLLESGKIRSVLNPDEEFNTPSSWAHHCKRLVNPIKRSGCGWASVKYNNKKLDIWKSIWARKNRLSSSSPYKASEDSQSNNTTSPSKGQGQQMSPCPSASSSTHQLIKLGDKINETIQASLLQSSSREDASDSSLSKLNQDNEMDKYELVGSKEKMDSHKAHLSSLQKMLTADSLKGLQNIKSKPLAQIDGDVLNFPNGNYSPKDITWKTGSGFSIQSKFRTSVPYSALGSRSVDIDPHTLVQCEKFDSHSKLQPFTVSMNSNSLLLMDFHCYLTKSEVVGYLGGRWDTSKQHLSIEQVFPAFCRLGDSEKAAVVEQEIQRQMRSKQMTLVGWYHSHPYSTADPSVHDVDCQMSYQLKMRGSGSMYQPCLAFIVSPFDISSRKLDSQIQAFWVMPNLEHPAAYNIPMNVTFSVQRDSSLTEEILADMKQLSEFYSGAQDKLIMKDTWQESLTYVDKIRASIKSKLPEDQLDSGTFLDYMQQLLRDMR